jgi:hypothetical protein
MNMLFKKLWRWITGKPRYICGVDMAYGKDWSRGVIWDSDTNTFRVPEKWITNVRDAIVNTSGGADCCDENSSICCACGKKLARIWDTVCDKCGDTSCYEHSTVVSGKWRCEKCK